MNERKNLIGTLRSVSGPLYLKDYRAGLMGQGPEAMALIVFIETPKNQIYQLVLLEDIDRRQAFCRNFGKIMLTKEDELVEIDVEPTTDDFLFRWKILEFKNVRHPEYDHIL